MTDPVVARLHRCLVEAVRRRGAEPLDTPLKVSEIYRELVPYGAVRGSLGVELNADYEHALLRLLAGEGGLVRVEPDTARAELRQEAEAAFPVVGLYRKFADADAWIMAAAPQAPGAALSEDAAVPDGVAGEAFAQPAPEEEPASHPWSILAEAPTFPEPAPHVARPVGRNALTRPPAHAAGARAGRRIVARAAECAFCDQPLPVGRRVRYCPSCGSDQRLRPCPRCDEVLERTWRFCVNCGLEVPVVPSPRPPDPDE